MSNNIKLACFLLLLPFLAAIGHDVYLNYFSDPEKTKQVENLDIDPSAYLVSDLGYIFVNYTPEFYDNTKEMVGQENWTRYVDPVLQQYTFAVALAPAVLFYLYLLIARLAHLPPFRITSGSTFRAKTEKTQKGEFKYKRR